MLLPHQALIVRFKFWTYLGVPWALVGEGPSSQTHWGLPLTSKQQRSTNHLLAPGFANTGLLQALILSFATPVWRSLGNSRHSGSKNICASLILPSQPTALLGGLPLHALHQLSFSGSQRVQGTPAEAPRPQAFRKRPSKVACVASLHLTRPWPLGHHWIVSVAQLCQNLCDPMDCSLPGSSVHGIL